LTATSAAQFFAAVSGLPAAIRLLPIVGSRSGPTTDHPVPADMLVLQHLWEDSPGLRGQWRDEQ
jgi:hypothetical protein